MDEFRSTLSAFLAGQTEFAQLDAALVRALRAEPAEGPAAFAAIDQLYRSGRLPLQLFVQLKNRIAESHAMATGSPSARPPGNPVAPAGAAGAPAPEQPVRPVPPVRPERPMPPEAADGDALEPGGQTSDPSAVPPPPDGDRTILRSKASPGDSGAAGPSGGSTSSSLAAPQQAPPTGGFDGRTGGGAHATGPTGGFDGRTGGAAYATGPTGRSPTGASRTTGATGGTGGSGWSDLSRLGERTAAVMERGSVLNGRFVLENVVGRGGMGVVFRAKDLNKEAAQDRDPYVAIKILNDEFRRHPESLKALQREARKSQDLAHPNIVNVFDFDIDRENATVYMNMEFLEGESLDRIIKGAHFEGYSFREAYPLIEGLCRALSYAHSRGIVHSDFKPGNCFLTKSGLVKVFDLGIAQAAKLPGNEQGEVTRFDPGTLGALTPAYASCEMIEGEAPDPRDDVYALGCVSYELLTGRHPFNKRSATEARDAKLVPAPVKSLSRRQWRALRKTLAFSREQRSATVDEFLDGLRIQPFNATRVAIAVAGLLVVSVAGYFAFVYWQDRQTERLITALESRDSARVPAALEGLKGLEGIERATVLQQVRDPLLDWYEARVNAAVNESQSRYDYPQAEKVLKEAALWYPDSQRLGDLRSRIERRKNELLAELDKRFNDALKAGRLTSDPDTDDVPDVLAILAQVQPDHPLMHDQRLAFAYADKANAALSAGNLASAKDLIDLGLDRYPDDARFANLRDALKAAQQSQQNAARIAELRGRLAGLDGLHTMGELTALQSVVTELAALSPQDSLLAEYRKRLAAAFDAALGPLLASRDFDGADRVIAEVTPLLPDEDLRKGRDRLNKARDAYTGQRDKLMARLDGETGAGHLGDARKTYADLEGMHADQDSMLRARNAILQGYVTVVQGDLNAKRFDDAEAIVAQGLAFDSSSASLLKWKSAIAEQRRVAALQDKQEAARQRIVAAQSLRQKIHSALGPAPMTMDEAASAVADADQLALLAPDDEIAGAAGREQIATKLAKQAADLASRDQWDQALALVEQASGLIGDSASLRDERKKLNDHQNEVRASRDQQQLAEERQALDALLGKPTYDAGWAGELRQRIANIRRLVPASDPTVGQAQQRAAALFVARAGAMREQERFDEAERLLGEAKTFAPSLEALATEQAAVATARSRWERNNAEQLRKARIDGLKQTFMAKANADDVNEARATLKDLRGDLPADDEFLTTTAPRAISDIFLRLAKGAVARSDFSKAEDLVDEGLREWKESNGLKALLDDIHKARAQRLNANVAKIASQLDGGATGDVAQAKDLLAMIKSDASSGYADIEKELTAKAEKHIAANPTNKSYLSWVTAVFGRQFSAPVPKGRPCTLAMQGLGVSIRAHCHDELADGIEGPTLVVVPAGGGIRAPFAIGLSEVTIGDWDAYCRLSDKCKAKDGQDKEYPVTGVSAAAIEKYAAWMTSKTGFTYRLPTRAEWMHVASAPRTRYQIDFNCITPGIGRGGTLRHVKKGGGNDWGVVDYLGNVQELVKAGKGYEARGGDYQDPLSRCTKDHVQEQSGEGDAYTGFRLVRELAETRK